MLKAGGSVRTFVLKVCLVIALLCVQSGARPCFAASGDSPLTEPTPLMPHPPDRFNRPVFSQDRYKRNPIPEEPPIEVLPPSFSQDRYERNSAEEDYTGELRKVPEKGHEWSEIEIAKGIVALNSGTYPESIAHFEKALKWDPRNFVAVEYLSSVYERKGDLSNAIATLARAKHMAPKSRWGHINFQIGRLYLVSKNLERAEVYLRLAQDEGGPITAVFYTLGYLLYLEERFFEAEHYLHEARMRATRRTALAPEREMIQAINYYLGEIYARLGFTQYAVLTLRGTELGDSWEVRQAAWRVHSEINHYSYYVTLGFFGQFDSNVVVVPVNGALPTEFSSQGGFGTVLTANSGIQTSPAKKWVAGLDGTFYLNNHINKTLAGFDVLNLGVDAWVNFWNQENWSFLGRYDFNDVLNDRKSFSKFQSTTGPLLSANYFPFQRWNWEAGAQYRMNSFATDIGSGPDRRSGTTYVGYFRASLRAPNPRLRPTFGYTFELDNANGLNFQARSHILSVEADWRLFSQTHFVGGITVSRVLYPNHLQGRTDTIEQVRMGLNHIFTPHWIGVGDITSIGDESSLGGYSYKRLIVTAGATYTF